MRLSVVLLLCSLAGILGGGALLGVQALGACLIFDSVLVGAYGLVTHDWAKEPPTAAGTLEAVLERARSA